MAAARHRACCGGPLLQVAGVCGLVRVWMDTNHDWHEAIGLYRRCGFQEFARRDGCIFMALDLPGNLDASGCVVEIVRARMTYNIWQACTFPDGYSKAHTTPEEEPWEPRADRSRTDRMIAGVCGGLGKYLGIDPTLIRLAFVLLLLFGIGSGLWCTSPSCCSCRWSRGHRDPCSIEERGLDEQKLTAVTRRLN